MDDLNKIFSNDSRFGVKSQIGGKHFNYRSIYYDKGTPKSGEEKVKFKYEVVVMCIAGLHAGVR